MSSIRNVSNLCSVSVIGAALAVAIGCALPGKLYPISPAISGRIAGGDPSPAASYVTLTLQHRENPTLFVRRQAPLSASGHFAFDAASLDIAGKEYSKNYRAFLYLGREERSRVIWRADFSRLRAEAAIELDCDADRPIRQGQPCWVVDPLRHPWLVAQGERSYRRLCAECHGPGGVGGVAAASDSPRTSAPNLTQIALRHGGHFDRARVAERIEGRSLPAAHGDSAMPIWGERLSLEFDRYVEGDALIGATLDPLIAYLASLQSQP